MNGFRRLINKLTLREAYLNVRRYTWLNEREQATLVRLDRIFSSSEWEDLHPDCTLPAISSSVSDHYPLVVDLAATRTFGKRFHFENFWVCMDGFLDTVEQAWRSTPPIANPFKALDARLRATAKALDKWSARRIGNIKLQILVATELIFRLDLAMETRSLSSGELALRRTLKRKLLGLSSLERSIARQRSHLTWMKEGNANTKFFQRHAAA